MNSIAMKSIRTTLLIMLTVLSTPLRALSGTESCATAWTTHPAHFESAIQYDDMQSKANPTVHVLINGKAVKMMLDTGAQLSVLWDASLLDEMPSHDSQRVYAHVASADARKVRATLEDGHGNALRHEFYFLSDSILATYGYAGILSPQAVAGENVAVIDLEKNCLFTSAPFDIRSNDGFDVRRGTTISNPYGFMAVMAELDGREIPLLVDTGAESTSISASLVAHKAKGEKSPRGIDMFGAEVPSDEHMRLVDLKINGQMFRSLPVIPRSTIGKIEGIVDGDEEGLENYGYFGMDILRNRVIYHDGDRQEFILLTRQNGTTRAVSGHEPRMERYPR